MEVGDQTAEIPGKQEEDQDREATRESETNDLLSRFLKKSIITAISGYITSTMLNSTKQS